MTTGTEMADTVAADFMAERLMIPVVTSRASYNRARRLMQSLRADRTEGGRQKRRALSLLIEDYELNTTPPPPSDPVDALEFYMAQHDLSHAEFAKRTGISASRISEILGGKRGLSLDMIRKLHRHTSLPLETLIAEPERRKARVRG